MENKGIIYSGIFMIAFLTCAIISSVYGMWNIRGDTQSITAKDAVNGKWTSAYERNFDKGLHFHDNSKSLLGILNYSLFKQGRSGVLVGEDGWLFTSEEFSYPKDAPQNIERNLQYIKDVQSLLDTKNINLIIALVPAKARIYNNKITRYKWPEEKKKIYHEVRKDLKDNNIVVTDIEWLFNEKKDDFNIFLKTDTHWTPTGAKMAARSIASEIENEFRFFYLENNKFESHRGDVIAYDGDLLRYIPLGNFKDTFGLKKDRFKKATTEKVASNDETSLSSDLFGDENLSLALVGTSYSANPTWNFAGFLKEAIGKDILNVADEGLGPFETMENYLNDQNFTSMPPELVIWEIPERFLTFKYDLDPIS